MQPREPVPPVELPALPRAMIHQRNEDEVEQRRVENQDEVVGIPPAVKDITGHEQPRYPKSCAPQREQQRQHHRHEDGECPGMKEHREGSAAEGDESLVTPADMPTNSSGIDNMNFPSPGKLLGRAELHAGKSAVEILRLQLRPIGIQV